jgi:hypothetical protein
VKQVPTREKQSETLWSYTAPQVAAVLAAAGMGDAEREILDAYRLMSRSWSTREQTEIPRWSGLSGDCSPMEMSLVVGVAQPEVHLLVEAQADPADPDSYWEAATGLTRELCARWGLDATQFDALADLFRPNDAGKIVYWSCWHKVIFRLGHAPAVKLYLNPVATSRPARATVAEAMARLDLAQGWSGLAGHLKESDQLLLASIDLNERGRAQFEVFVRAHPGREDDLERLCRLSPLHRGGEAGAFFHRALGPAAARAERRGMVSLRYTPGIATPTAAVPQVPLWMHAMDNRTNQKRFRSLLRHYGLPDDSYTQAVDALLELTRARRAHGLHSWVSLEQEPGSARVTVHFNPRVYMSAHGAIALEPNYPWPSAVRWALPARPQARAEGGA